MAGRLSSSYFRQLFLTNKHGTSNMAHYAMHNDQMKVQEHTPQLLDPETLKYS